MKLTVTQENLAGALATVSRIASSKTSLPILGNILIKTVEGRLQLAATNLEIAIVEHIGGSVKTDGAVTVPARLTHEFISSLPAGNVTLTVDGTTLHIESDGYTSKIHGMPADEFPALPQITATQTFEPDASQLKRAIQQVIPVASHDDTRPALTGIYWHTFDKALYMAGTDGYRLAEKKLQAQGDGEDIAAIVPASTLQEVVRVLGDEVKTAYVLLDDNQIRFDVGSIQITSKLIDGSFPDYRQLIPKQSDITFTLAKDEFSRITKVASLFARDSGGGITIMCDSNKGSVSIHSIASQLGENTSEAAAKVTADGSVTLNSRYLIEALNCVDGSPVTFAFSGKVAPCVLSAPEAGDYMHVIMPLNS